MQNLNIDLYSNLGQIQFDVLNTKISANPYIMNNLTYESDYRYYIKLNFYA